MTAMLLLRLLMVLFTSRSTLATDCSASGQALVDVVETADGIHSLDICQLSTSLHAAPGEKDSRACTAALVLVDGQAMAITAATCFYSADAEVQKKTLKQAPDNKGIAFNGKVTLTCGPKLEKLELESTFQNEVVLLHSKADLGHTRLTNKKRSLFAEVIFGAEPPSSLGDQRLYKHNIAVVRIGAADLERIPDKTNWLFTRIADTRTTTGPTEETTCRCYSGPEKAASGDATPKEHKAEKCPVAQRVLGKYWGSENTCFVVRKDINTNVFTELATGREKCDENGFCGILQTMACFCKAKGPDITSLRTLHSIGFYRLPDQKDTAQQLLYFGVPIAHNWPFIIGAKGTGTPAGGMLQRRQARVADTGRLFS